jgi:hypothetical protein
MLDYGAVLLLLQDDARQHILAQLVKDDRWMKNRYYNDHLAIYKETRKTPPQK